MARILIVEDNEDWANLAREILAAQGLDMDWACAGAEAEERLRRRDYDLVLMDLDLPDMRGSELLRRLHARRGKPRPHVLILSVFSPSAEADRGSYDEWLRKPVGIMEIAESVNRLLGVKT